jgi:hypothetical protein
MPNTARQRIPKSDTDYGPVGSSTIRTAAQIGNSTGPADFGAGAITAQTLRVALAQGSSIGLASVNVGVHTYDEQPAVVPSSTTVIAQYTPAQEHFLLRVSGSGEADGEFLVRVNGVVIAKKRNNWTDRNVDFEWGKNGIPVTSGQTIELVVIHRGVTNSPFNGTLYGEEV